MKIQAPLAGVHILSLIGQQGTGKTTLGRLLATKLNAQFIEASSVVSEATGVVDRTLMPFTNERTKSDPNWLGRLIAERITGDVAVIAGVREYQVHEYLSRQAAYVEVVSLWAPENERFARVSQNGKVELYSEFMQHGQSELDIGLDKLLQLHPPQYVTSYESLDEIADAVMEGNCNLLS